MARGILARIAAHKRAEVAARKTVLPLAAVRRNAANAPPPLAFADALRRKGPAVVAEIKQASPSAGVIRADCDAPAIARAYRDAGAACLSVVTDTRFFQGSDTALRLAKQAAGLPTLRKDFMLDAYQIHESRALGADCVLLIAALLEPEALARLAALAAELGMDALVEVHDSAELNAVLPLEPKLVGVNNRDLRTFEVRLETTIALRARLPDDVLVVAESGIHTPRDLRRLRAAGVEAFLVGTALMRDADPGRALRKLLA